MPKKTPSFKFAKHDSIGAPAAEDDAEYLHDCFIDSGDFTLLRKMDDRRIIVLGRTGAGKSALFEQLKFEESAHVIKLRPTGLALTHVSGSDVIRFFSKLGINLDPFYKLLWRHVITVEILTRFFSQYNPSGGSLYDWMRSFFSGNDRKSKESRELIQYLETWGARFWNETEYRVKEITGKIENELADSLKATIGKDIFGVGGEKSKSFRIEESQKIDVITNAQTVVARAQIADLSKASSLLDQILSDRKKNYYVLIDGLDEDWIEDTLRYRLILSLIESAREFIGSRNAKIIIALRRDLIDRVFRLARTSGFQEEKYRGLYLPIVWNKENIIDLLNRRIEKLVRFRYTSKSVLLRDLFPSVIREQQIEDFIFSVANRPRDAIAFVNTCIDAASNKSKLTARDVLVAVGEYSRSRLRALADEWIVDYPELIDFAKILQNRSISFKMKIVKDNEIDDLVLDMLTRFDGRTGFLIEQANGVINGSIDRRSFLYTLFHVFYRVGLVGLKVSAEMKGSWVDDAGQSISIAQVDPETSVIVSQKYAYALGILPIE
jgi:hypothetical protein